MESRQLHSNGKAAVILFLLVLLLSTAVVATGQDIRTPQRGFTAANSYTLGGIETLNTTNGNLIFNIPLASLPAGRGGSSLGNLHLLYNSKMYDGRHYVQYDQNGHLVQRDYINKSPEGGWRYGFAYKLELVDRMAEYMYGQSPQCPDTPAQYIYKLKVTFPDGSVHEFRPQGFQDVNRDGYFDITPDGWRRVCQCAQSISGPVCTTPFNPYTSSTMTYYSTDGTYMRLDFAHDSDMGWQNNPWTLYLPDGSRVTGGNGPQRTYDRNNNYVEIQPTSYNNHPATRIVDQLNRAIIIEYDQDTRQDYVRSWGVNNEELVWTVKWKDIHVYKTFNMQASMYPMEMNIGFTVVEQITLPAQAGGLTYTFDYNPGASNPSYGWGEVSSVTLPSGAQAHYDYKYDGQNSLNWDTVLKNHPSRKDFTYLLEYDGATTSKTDTWLYSINNTYSHITNPDGGGQTEEFYDTTVVNSFRGLAYKSSASDGTLIERVWQKNSPWLNDTLGRLDAPPENPYVKTQYTSIRDAAGTLVKTAVKDFNYDKNGNVTRVAEYDWVPYGSIARNASGQPTGALPPGQPRRITVNSYYSPTPDATSGSENGNAYYKATSPRLRDALEWSEVRSGDEQAAARTEFFYDNATTTGNLTQQRSWDSTKGAYSTPLTAANSISVSHQYDVYGNHTLSTDARGYQTKLDYGPVGGFTDLYPTQITMAYQTGAQRTATQAYDFYSGLVTSSTDVDNNVTNETVYDVFGRPVEIRAAVNVPEAKSIARMEYSDLQRRVITRSDLNDAYDGKLVTVQHYDQLGRPRLTRQLEPEDPAQNAADETLGIKVQTRYLISGSNTYQLKSNPYRAQYSGAAAGEVTMGWTRSKTDPGGRTVEVKTFRGAQLPAPWGANATGTGAVLASYDADYVTVTDQAGKVRRSMTDALGRLARVDEPDATNSLGPVDAPVQPTSYTSDVLSNLIRVVQGRPVWAAQGGQERVFQYSSLSRLTSAANPESGTISYQYDANGNLTQKTDARGVTTTYGYDALNRLTARTYNDGITPWVTYGYDSAAVAYSRGRLTSVGNSVSTTNYTGYDALGRVTASQQVTDGQAPYNFPAYIYDRAGHLKSEVYPSGRVVSADYDNAGRISAVKGQKPGDAALKLYASNFSYTAHGEARQVKLGNNLWENTIFNDRFQPALMGLGTVRNLVAPADVNRFRLDYYYGESNNNGNVLQQTITVPDVNGMTVGQVSQTYGYDELNRLSGAQETQISTGAQSWSQTFAYDIYGNRRFASGTTTLPSLTDPRYNPAFDPANNRLATGQGLVAYDAAGNLKNDYDGHSFDYDAEDRQIRYDNGAAVYSYDGDGRRVKKAVGNVQTIFVYNAAGRLIAEYSTSNPVGSGGTSYLTVDNLNTPRVVTDSNGAVKSRHDYLPFGEELAVGVGGRTGQTDPITGAAGQKYVYGVGNDGVRQKFTGYQRDDEAQLDYAQARYYSSAQGRFTSADKPFMDQQEGDPQSWNLYAYVRNNPLIFTDPTGMWHWVDPDVNGHRFIQWDPGDDWLSLARFLNHETSDHYEPADLARDFGPGSVLGEGLIIDLSGTRARFTNVRGLEDKSFDFYMTVLPFAQGAKGLWAGFRAGLRGLGGLFARRAARAGVQALRQEYEAAVRALAEKVIEMRAGGKTAEEIAIQLHAERRALGIKYKDMTPPEILEKILERNVKKYGDPLGPSIDWLRAQGKSWEDIIESAIRPGGKDLEF